MGKMQIFENSEFGQIRGGLTKSGKPWFVLKDVCEAFGETNYRRVASRLDEEEKGVSRIDTPGGKQKMIIISESGLYSALFTMQPKEARGVSQEYITKRQEQLRKFKRWVTSEVLPSIREHGAYMTPDTLEQALCNPDYLLKLATVLKEEHDKRIEAEKQNEFLAIDNKHKENIINGLTEDISLAEKRQRIIQIIRHRANASQIATRWGLLYSEFNKKYHCNVKLRFERQREEFKPKLKNPLDYIERGMNMITELYEIACKLFESDVDSLLEEWSVTITREDFVY